MTARISNLIALVIILVMFLAALAITSAEPPARSRLGSESGPPTATDAPATTR